MSFFSRFFVCFWFCFNFNPCDFRPSERIWLFDCNMALIRNCCWKNYTTFWLIILEYQNVCKVFLLQSRFEWLIFYFSLFTDQYVCQLRFVFVANHVRDTHRHTHKSMTCNKRKVFALICCVFNSFRLLFFACRIFCFVFHFKQQPITKF